MMAKAKRAKPLDSADFKLERFGILNAQGDFWTPDVFESEDAARQHIRDFWCDNRTREECLRTHRIVPVHVTVRQADPA